MGEAVPRARELLERWFRPVVSAPTWIALAYLFVGAIWAPLLFAAVLVVVAVTFGLVFAAVGIVLVLPAFGLIDAMCGVERSRARWVGPAVSRRPPSAGAERSSWWSRTVSALGDAERWRPVAFAGSFLVVAPLLLAVALLPWFVVVQLIVNVIGAAAAVDLLLLPVAVLGLGLAPRLTTGVAGVEHSFTAWFLGPDSSDALRKRVDELSIQRQLILDAVATERHRIERNLHDGVQQQLVALGIDVALASQRIESDPDEARHLLDAAKEKVRSSIGELRLIGRGLHPSILEDRGLDAALSAAVAHSPIPIDVEVTIATPPGDDVAATAYYVVTEAVANVLKHARARSASIRVESNGPWLHVAVRDDGCGGADPRGGSGLAGMRARVEAIDGRLDVESPVGGPTVVSAVLPVEASNGANVTERAEIT